MKKFMKKYEKHNKEFYKQKRIDDLENKMRDGSITFGERMEYWQLRKDYPF